MEEMLIEKVKADSAIDWSPHHHAYVNPYNGCTAGCPFCFWLSRQGWEGRIQIRENITELLENELPSKGKTCPSINTDKRGKKQALQMKLYQKIFANCFSPRRMLSRTRLGSTPSAPAISFTLIPR